MKYLSVTEAAKVLKLSRARVHVLIQSGRIKGAIQIGNQWAIPAPPVVLPIAHAKP